MAPFDSWSSVRGYIGCVQFAVLTGYFAGFGDYATASTALAASLVAVAKRSLVATSQAAGQVAWRFSSCGGCSLGSIPGGKRKQADSKVSFVASARQLCRKDEAIRGKAQAEPLLCLADFAVGSAESKPSDSEGKFKQQALKLKEHDRRDEAAAASLAPGDQDRQIRQLKRELKEAKVKMWNAQDDADEADACYNKLKAKAKANRAELKAQVTALHTQLDCIKFEAQATKQKLQQQVEGLRFQVHRAEQQVGHPDTSNRPPSQFVAAACTSSDPVPYDAIWFWVYPLPYFVIIYYSWQFSLWAMAQTCVNLWAVHHVVNCLEQWAYPIPEVD